MTGTDAAHIDDVESLLAQLEQAAIELFPRWLPDAALFEGPQGGAIAAVRVAAAGVAAVSEHYGPYLADLAECALRSRGSPGDHPEAGAGADIAVTTELGTAALRSRFSAAVRSAELARVIAEAHQCSSAAMIVEVPAGLSRNAERALTAALDWIAHHGAWQVGLAVTESRPEISSPDFSCGTAEGRPRPDSPAELALEAALQAQPWAAGRVWNRFYQSGLLAPSYRLDLWWQAERCVVEIDGPEHRSTERYAADRRRDVQLQLDGQCVLRFTNDDVLTDVTAVTARIERLLRSRRL